MPGCDFTLYDMIARNARLYAGKSAILYGDTRLSFLDYQTRCDQCAAGLIRDGLTAGDRIAVLSANCADFLVLCGAAAKIGAILVLVNFRLGEGEISYIFQDTQPVCIVASPDHKDMAQKSSLTVPSLRKHYVFNAKDPDDAFLPFETLLVTTDHPAALPTPPSGSAPCLMIHTAAVGGKPRGCVLSQANLMAAGFQIADLFKLTNCDCHVGTLPLFHIGGMALTLAAMLRGGGNVIIDRFDPVTVLRQTQKEHGTFFCTFPPMLAAILDAQEKQSLDAASLRSVCGMDSPDTIERFLKNNPGAAFYSLYGQTEAMPVSGCDVRERPGSIGRPALMTRAAIFDDMDRELAPGEQGEICVHSPSVFLGYWNLAQDTAHTSRNGWHHTGDRGRIDEVGYLYYLGRNPEKELIKPGGENVYPAEVEKVILSHGDIEEVAVVGIPDPEWGEAVLAVCVLKKGRHVNAAELIEFVASRIARYKKPKQVVFVERLPKKAGGETDREAVKKICLTRT
ncbi:MAG: long-chain fatty acid--CoA ligase [Deltaproteobacteria bacterium]|nr:long-chain fatty acid--CoA ligase [Deltaproteobacteria bacterium]